MKMNMIETKIQFKEIEEIGNGQGRNSRVFLAEDIQLGTELVIKQISKESLNNQGLNLDNYFMEAKTLYASKNPYVMEIQYASQDDKNIYLAMPFLKSGSLSSKMNNEFLTIREVIKYSVDILSGLNVIHSKGLIHLDIKPTNILIDDSGKAIITDFGLSRFLDNDGFVEQGFNYNLHRDPEGFIYEKRSIFSDIYQMGATLYRMCNGNNILDSQKKYFEENGKSFKDCVLNGEFPMRQYYLPHVPKKLQRIINKCLNVDVTRRYNNVLEIMNDINSIDECLDWRYCPNTEYIYQKVNDNNKIFIKIENHNEKYNIVCIRTNKDGKNPRRINQSCISNISDNEALTKNLISIIKNN